jgi:hypothetical protein
MLKVLQCDLHGVFYGCETWSIAMDETRNGSLGEWGAEQEFGPKLEKLKRRLQEILYVTALPNITLVVKWTIMRRGVAQ